MSVHLVKGIQRTLTVTRRDPAVLDYRPEVQHRCFRAVEVVYYGVSVHSDLV